MGMIYSCHWKQKAWASISAKWLQVVMSVPRLCLSTISDVWWFDSIFLSIGCFPTGISDGQQNQRVYNQRVNCMHQCSILNLLDIPSWQGIWVKPPDIFLWGGLGWLDIRLFTPLTRNTCTFFIISEKLEVLSELVKVAGTVLRVRRARSNKIKIP